MLVKRVLNNFFWCTNITQNVTTLLLKLCRQTGCLRLLITHKVVYVLGLVQLAEVAAEQSEERLPEDVLLDSLPVDVVLYDLTDVFDRSYLSFGRLRDLQ